MRRNLLLVYLSLWVCFSMKSKWLDEKIRFSLNVDIGEESCSLFTRYVVIWLRKSCAFISFLSFLWHIDWLDPLLVRLWIPSYCPFEFHCFEAQSPRNASYKPWLLGQDIDTMEVHLTRWFLSWILILLYGRQDLNLKNLRIW